MHAKSTIYLCGLYFLSNLSPIFRTSQPRLFKTMNIIIQWINLYPMDNTVCRRDIYLLNGIFHPLHNWTSEFNYTWKYTNKIRGTYRSQSQCILMRGSCFAYSLIRKIYTEDRTGNNLYYISLEDLYTSYTYVARIHTVRVKLRYFSNYIHEQTMLWIIGHFRYVKIQTWLHGLLE